MPKKRNFNAYRNGKVHVCAALCKTCIYRPETAPHVGRDIKRLAVEDNTAVICHSTLDKPKQAVCRGFYEFDKSVTLRLADALGVTVFVPVD